jgi:hypothetical protein
MCGEEGHCHDIGDRGRKDDGAAPAGQRRELLGREKRPLGVQVEHLVVGRLGRVLDRSEEAVTGVDEEKVEGVELGLHPSGESVDVRQ